ncbi:putative integral membrane protein Pth11-like [Aspergillus undulatus]|uniref:putative integral membrane protein Pth11-like n=1 Tax=Aspergillus undulatus TaxID=1810928 RepID=UPI003CCDCAEA
MAESQGPVVTGVAVVFAVITFFVLILRVFARIYVLKKMGVDDFLIIFACCFAWAFSSVTVVAVNHGLGKHIKDVDPDGMTTYSFNVWLSSMFYLACLGFVKTSVCWFYTRLGDKFLTRLSFTMFTIVACQATANVLTAAFQCNPVRGAWDKNNFTGHCVNINVFYLANAALNILTDLLTYTLPVRVILKLQLPRKQKIALVFILCLGLFACVSSIIRITYIPEMLTSADATWAISGAMYWSVIEINIGILAASIPSFKAIASRFLPRLIGEYTSNKAYGYGARSGSGFSKVRDPSQSHNHDQSHSRSRGRSVGMHTLRKNRDGDNDHAVMGTNIHSALDRTSEERIFVPEGKIYAHTEIEVRQG